MACKVKPEKEVCFRLVLIPISCKKEKQMSTKARSGVEFHSGNSLQTTNFMINDPLQKQIVPFTLEKCVVRIIWQITRNLNWVAFCLSAQLLFIATHLSRLGILKLEHQTCWLSCYSYVMKLLNCSDLREIFVGVSLLQNQPGGSACGLAPRKKGNTGCYTWVTFSWCKLPRFCGLLGLSESHFLFCIFEVISLRSYFLFCCVQHSKSEPCWENVGCLWGLGGGSFREAAKDNEHQSILLNVLLLKKPMTAKIQPMLSARLDNQHSKNFPL